MTGTPIADDDSTPERSCQRCGKRLVRKQYRDRPQSLSSFMSRKYCSLRCSRSQPRVAVREIFPDPGDGMGPYMLIPLSRGLFAKCSPEDFDMLSATVWSALVRGLTPYAVGRPGPGQHRPMHRVVSGEPDGYLVDHRNHDGLDNRRANLRPATQQQNLANRRKVPGFSSGYIGVSWSRRHSKWFAQVSIGGVRSYLGSSRDEAEAARYYDYAVRRTRGEFASPNFPIAPGWRAPDALVRRVARLLERIAA